MAAHADYLSDAREASWGVVQQTVSALDFDFGLTAPGADAGTYKALEDAPSHAEVNKLLS